MYALRIRTRLGRRALTIGSARSAPVDRVHAWSIGAAAAAKKRRERSVGAARRHSCSATACAAATVMPCP